MPDSSQFNTDRTYPGRWTITFSNPPINMFVPTTIVELGTLITSYGVRSDFELNFGRYLPAFGRADDDDADTQLVAAKGKVGSK